MTLFIITIACARSLGAADFADLSLVVTLAFIVIVASRAWTINAPVVLGARQGLMPIEAIVMRRVLVASSSWAIAGAVIVIGALSRGAVPTATDVRLALLCVVLLYADAIRQAVIYSGLRLMSLSMSAGYALAAVVLWPVWLRGDLADIALFWAAVVGAIAGVTHRRVKWTEKAEVPDLPGLGSFQWRMSAEAIYVGTTSQLAIFATYSIGDAESTVGFRLAYVVAVAPVMVLVQAATPVYMDLLARERAKGQGFRQRAALWVVAVFLIGLLGVGSGATAHHFADRLGENFELLGGFVLPVAVYALGSNALEGVLNAERFLVDPALMHRWRIGMVSVDLASQLAGLAVAGVGGLLVALVVLGSLRTFAALALVFRMRARPGH